ncbi:MAG: hypothetical protein ACFB6R_10825 [Alphaproteobacteria bacterium]
MSDQQFPFDEDAQSVPPLSDDDLEGLIEEAPRLALIKPFLESVRRAAWFRDVGSAPNRAVRTHAQHYLDGLGFPDVSLATVADWLDAADAATAFDLESPAWEAEEQIRAALTVEAVDGLGEEVTEVALTHIAAEAAGPVRSSIAEVAALWDVTDRQVVNAAAGGAVQACHLAALTLITGRAEDSHPFAAKFALFEAGRWPIGIAGSTFNLF